MTPRSKLRAAAAAFVLLALVALGASCGTRQPMEDRRARADVDRKLSTFAFIEEGKIVTFIVDTHATRFREDTAYIPIEISVANKGLRQLRLTRESFTLVDAEGNRYPVAGPEELLQSYDHLELDRQSFAELPGIVFNKYAAFTQYPSKFSPTNAPTPGVQLSGGSTLVRDLVSLPKFGFLIDFLYFPMPEVGVRGQRFELFMDSQDLEDPVFVKFIVK